jgi:hypothetical protein
MCLPPLVDAARRVWMPAGLGFEAGDLSWSPAAMRAYRYAYRYAYTPRSSCTAATRLIESM